MSKITQVEKQKKNPNRYNIFLDGKFAFGADEDTVVSLRLIEGKELSVQELEVVLFETEVGRLMERIYHLLGIRLRSEREVRDYLYRLNFQRKVKGKEELSEVVIEALIKKLYQKGLLNDKQFAKSWVESRAKSRGLGVVKGELIKKGIDRETIDDVLTEEAQQGGQESVARKLLEKKWGSWQKLLPPQKKKKAYEFLLRRGFDYDLAKELVLEMLQEKS
jgi:regulatory protein